MFYVRCYNHLLELEANSVQSDEEVVFSLFDRGDLITQTKLYWQPSGALVAGISGENIVFWEKNQLKHSEF